VFATAYAAGEDCRMPSTYTDRLTRTLTPRRTTAVAATTFALIASCTGASADGQGSLEATSAPASSGVAGKAPVRHLVARNINVPWGIAFLPRGGMLVTSRDTGKVLLVHGNGSKRVARAVKGVVSTGQQGGEGGLLGIALSPHFKRDHWVYVYMSTANDNRIIRMRWSHRHLGAQHLILKGIPTSLHHNGGRIAFGPDGKLYATTGEAEVPSRSQNRHSLGGKILRMTPLGKPAPGNPWRHSVVYSIGHRNVEGLAWDPQGRLWATEFGDQTWDELNLIKPGHNYGWPIVEGRSSDSRFTNPKSVWHTDQCGPSGIAITRVHGHTVAYIGSVTGQRIWRVQLKGRKVVHRHAWYVGQLGRIRTTYMHGGKLYFTTSNTDGRATPRPNDDKIFWVNPH
jgi:glucose/arabinose dehydrogenase